MAMVAVSMVAVSKVATVEVFAGTARLSRPGTPSLGPFLHYLNRSYLADFVKAKRYAAEGKVIQAPHRLQCDEI